MKKLLSLLLVFTLCISFEACNNGYQSQSRVYKKSLVSAAGEEHTVTYKDARTDEYQAFLDKLDLFAAKLTKSVYASSDKGANLAISPVSVYMALALATECSNGDTRQEILDAVGVTYEEVSKFTKYLYAFSNHEYTYESAWGNKKVSAFSELANSIWAHEGLPLNKQGLESLSNNYNCDSFSVDFTTNQAQKAINAYISDKTHGLIDGDIQFSPETIITLINTFYLKEIWNVDGDELKFTDDKYDFTNADGSTTATKLLKGYYRNGQAFEGENFTSFFTTTLHGYSIKFIVPNDGYSLESVFTAENIYAINNVSDYNYIDHENKLLHNTRVFFPEYKADFDGNLMSVLKQNFGINKLFDFDGCDFSNITDEPAYCEAVIHKCSLNVNARGIEGAAITVMPMAGAAGPGEYVEVYHDYIVDRAFGYVITDSYGAVLFSGVVNNI